MKHRNYRFWRPDPLLLLAVLVGIGVLVTTTAQAESTGDSGRPGYLREMSAQWALKPVQGLADRLDLHWLNTTLERPAVRQFVASKRLGMGKPFGQKGPELNMSLRPKIRNTAASSGDSGIGAIAADRPDIYFSLRRSW